MNTLSRILTLFLSFSTFALSDGGLPVDPTTNEVEVPHVMLTLSDSQTEEIESLGTLTLSSEQWKELRAISIECPKRIERILPATYRDCGCDLIGVFYGIQLSPTKVAVTHSEISYRSEKADVNSALKTETDVILRMDRRGEFYFGGSMIPFADLLKWVADSGKSDRHRWLAVVRPLGMKRDSPTAKDRLDVLFKTAKAVGWYEWDLALD